MAILVLTRSLTVCGQEYNSKFLSIYHSMCINNRVMDCTQIMAKAPFPHPLAGLHLFFSSILLNSTTRHRIHSLVYRDDAKSLRSLTFIWDTILLLCGRKRRRQIMTLGRRRRRISRRWRTPSDVEYSQPLYIPFSYFSSRR